MIIKQMATVRSIDIGWRDQAFFFTAFIEFMENLNRWMVQSEISERNIKQVSALAERYLVKRQVRSRTDTE